MVLAEGSLAAFFWNYKPQASEATSVADPLPSQTEQSQALSKELKKRGWKFVGPTTVYAFMQAMGQVNDHAADCVTRAAVDKAHKVFKLPG